MQIDLAFFDGDDLLCRARVRCGSREVTEALDGERGFRFFVTHSFAEPACPVAIVCERSGERQYEAALMVGVHASEDLESIQLGNVHTLVFRCVAAPC